VGGIVSGSKLNGVIAAGIALANSVVPLLQLLGVIHLTSDGVAAVYLVISNLGTFVGLLFAQSPATNTGAPAPAPPAPVPPPQGP